MSITSTFPSHRHLLRLLPSLADYSGFAKSWQKDMVAGLTVAVVALPLALGFGISAGLGPGAGLITAIVAGVIAAIFGGSDLQVSGPTGAMAVVLAPLVATYGPNSVAGVGVLAGIMVVLAGCFRMGRLLEYVPVSVIEGFTLGIAIIIFLQQVPSALGVPKPTGTNTGMVALRAVRAFPVQGSWLALMLVGIVVVSMEVCRRIHKAIPASLVAVIIATLVVVVAKLDVTAIGKIPQALPAWQPPQVSWSQWSEYLRPAFAVAALAAIESLLSAKVADGMTAGRDHNPDRELFGQGLANVGASLCGGMPATGAIARTAVNARAGAKTRVSAILHSLVLVVIVLFLGGLVSLIPLAALAGVLIMTSVRMVNVRRLRAVGGATRSDLVVLISTALVTVVFDLIMAVEVGVAIAAILALRLVARASCLRPTELDEASLASATPQERARIAVYGVDGALFFGTAGRFMREFGDVSDIDVVILRLPDLQVLDASGADAVARIVTSLEKKGITVLLKGTRPEHQRTLRVTGALSNLAHTAHIFDDFSEAAEHALVHVRRRGDAG